MKSIAENLRKIKSDLPPEVALVAVSKTKPNALLTEAYNAGQRIFGENRVQELVPKSETLPHDIDWHMIGHLQSNKVKFIAPFVGCIHSVDKLKVLASISREAEKNTRIIRVLLQFHIAKEETKFGLSINEASEILQSDQFKQMKNVDVIGVMGMGTFTEDKNHVRDEFKTLTQIFELLNENHFSEQPSFK